MSRYLHAQATNDCPADLIVVPGKHCQWCGKPLPKRCRRFCPAIDPDGRGLYQRCAAKYRNFWYVLPRFKRAVLVRDNFTCQLCGAHPLTVNEHGLVLPDVKQLEVDHIVPYSKGGATAMANLQTLCRRCNRAKGNTLLAEQQIDRGQLPLLLEVP